MSKQTQTKTNDNAVIGAGIRPQTQKIEQAQTQQQTAVADKVNTQQQTIAATVTETILEVRELAKLVTSYLKTEKAAKGAVRGVMTVMLYKLAKNGAKYVADLALPDVDDPATKAVNKEKRRAAMEQAAADMGYPTFLTPEATKRAWIDPSEKNGTEAAMRDTSGIALLLLRDGVEPTLTRKHLLQIPGRYLFTPDERLEERNEPYLDRILTMSGDGVEARERLNFNKSFTKAQAVAGQELGIKTPKPRGTSGQTGESAAPEDYKFSPTGAIEAAVFLTKYLQNRLAVGDAKPSRELRSELSNLFACLAKYNGAADEEVKHIDPKVADMILASATKGN